MPGHSSMERQARRYVWNVKDTGSEEWTTSSAAAATASSEMQFKGGLCSENPRYSHLGTALAGGHGVSDTASLCYQKSIGKN